MASVDNKNSYQLYKRLLTHTLENWLIFTFAIFGMVIVALSAAAFAALMKPLMDEGFVNRDPEVIKWIPILLVVIFFVRIIGAFLSSYGMSVIARNIIRELRRLMFNRLINLPKAFYDQATSGELISKFSYDVEQVSQAATRAVTVLVKDSLTLIALVSYMFYLNYKLAIVFLTITPLVALFIVMASKRFRHSSKNIQNSMGDVSRVVEEVIKGQLVVKIFGGQQYEEKQFSVSNDTNRRQNLRLQMTQALFSPLVQLLVAVALALIIYIATLPEMIGEVTPGVFTAFLTAMSMLMPSIRAMTSVVADLQRGIAAAESVFTFVDLETEGDTGDYQLSKAQGRLEFKQVNFSYDNAEAVALKNISISIEPGQTVAFVGRSGSGKSTLVNLIPRLYDINDGVITLDGVNIADYKLANLRSHIAYVGQDIILFNDTIEHNIAYGSMQEKSRDEIIEATRAAYAYDFIEESSDGFDTMVGERGVMLSGGQRQRVAIARALLNDVPILILDEATSALDTESERFIQNSLEKLMANRTTLVIAHRLSTIENADVIVVMDKGEIVESGTHKELLSLNGHYAALHQMNFEE